ncbi:disulfide bond formation protein B [Uliginosibacterium flavum]|uniref:Disulfide bond formation protein B n=1 Tax=Uliginosibacterium flavum TaxID=1396831 RepID=A0ABV2TP23_9RHOO
MYSKYPLRLVFLSIFAYCTGLIVFGLILQHLKGIEPCPLCILQRYGFVACGLIALVAGLSNAQGFMRRLYAFLTLAAAIAGGSVSVRQIWLQHNPPAETVCGPDLQYMIGNFPLSDALPMLFQGAGDCSKIDWTFLGLSIAQWALINFSLIAVVCLWQLFRRTPERRRFS